MNLNKFDDDLIRMVVNDFIRMEADERIKNIASLDIKQRFLLLSLCATVVNGGEE